jgi:hypothetical protein
MNNSIEAGVEFSYQGEHYLYTTVLDLEHLLRQHETLPSIHVTLARQHGVDTYSYLYEVMQEEEIVFSNPQGLAADYVINGEFDLAALEANWQTAKAGLLLQPIAAQQLGISDLEQHPALKNALIAAYQLGRGV